MFWEYREKSSNEEEIDRLSLRCLKAFCNKLYLVRDAADSWLVLDSECQQYTNAKERQFVGRNNFVMFAIPPPDRDLFYQAVRDV